MENPNEEQDSELTILPPLFWTAIIFLAFGLLAGCATPREAEVCFVKPMGQTEDGLIVVAQHCITPEAFAESQK